MVPGFEQTTRSLQADRSIARLGLVGLLVVVAGWGGWALFGEVTLYETSNTARIQADGIARLRAPATARVTEVAVRLGEPVRRGQTLIQLDDAEVRASLAASRARVASLEARLAAQEQADAATEAGGRAGDARRAATVQQARAELAIAEAEVGVARTTLGDLRRLAAAGATSAAELAAAEARLQAAEATASALRQAVAAESGGRTEGQLASQVATLREQQERLGLEAELAAARAAVERDQHAVEARRVEAPLDGTVGELAPIVAGQQVGLGELLVVVVPDGALVVDARFRPERARGRLQTGQPARVRIVGGGGLGAVRAVVDQVGSEPDAQGLVATRLRLPDPEVGLHHGLVAEVEVEVETLAPWELLMRASGAER